ncbi:MAG: hypothetical protein OEZ65_01335 [Gemmatimonadota bacterium]|nr:hypothetical protein [Gemmatimonadota bacterium]MDH5758199.1 hypothetical protein [Gemmatimonadota bacterium]
MTPGDRDRRQVLSDSEATLRQVQGVLSDLGNSEASKRSAVEQMVTELTTHPAGFTELVTVLVRTYTEIMGVIDSLRQSRGLLEQAAMERIKSTHEKLAEVSSATEVATTSMLDSVDRALGMVDDIEGMAAEGCDDPSEVSGKLRDELLQIMNLLQFQDITAQQLGYASGVLLDVEERMVGLAKLFDHKSSGGEEGVESDSIAAATVTNDPNATTLNAESRQALVDEIFTSPGG